MSGGQKGDHYHHYNHLLQDRDYLSDLSSLFSQRPGSSGLSDDLPGGGDALLSGFIDCNGLFDYGALERAFDMPCSSSEVDPFSLQGAGVKREEMAVDGNLNESRVGDGSAAPITPNSSVSSSSTEAAGEEDSGRCKKDQMKQEEEGEEEKQQQQQEVKVSEDGGDKSKKVSKPVKNKGEKRQRQPRFAFVTKSEVDHLEDGYRWRKYGQKAVKNSPYPRSYYRCTTQKCSVKKRVERSYQDPSIVITTYEGQHIHQSPANLRGGANILPPPPPPQLSAMATSFRQELLMHQIPQVSNNRTTAMQQMEANPNIYLPNMPSATTLQQLQFQDYGLLQDIVPSFMHSNQQ